MYSTLAVITCTLSVCAVILPVNIAFEAVILPLIFTLPEDNIEPVKINVSALTENAWPVLANILVDPVTVNPPEMLVDPVILN